MIIDIVLTVKAASDSGNLDIKPVIVRIEMWIFVFSHVITAKDDNWLSRVGVGSLANPTLNFCFFPRKRQRFKLKGLREKPQPLG